MIENETKQDELHLYLNLIDKQWISCIYADTFDKKIKELNHRANVMGVLPYKMEWKGCVNREKTEINRMIR